jgi:hypothetical protein
MKTLQFTAGGAESAECFLYFPFCVFRISGVEISLHIADWHENGSSHPVS